ncbi:ATP-dependent nuclease [Acidicapsa acidisoli]|uniref:ATP-dependent nuclease n=1 Tax=Acidicapsa acidisoli TaxID=1615681 RepID=UPI0021DF64CB|nr:ATP-dependent endonuclease [Acidicapsa acidisoli]
MRLRRFVIVNFKAIQRIELDFDDLLIVIGENNCGKSCALSALSIFLSGSAIKDTSLFHRHQADEANAIELIGYFDQLTATEQEESAVKGRTLGGEWILRKKFWMTVDSTDGEDKTSWKEELSSYSAPEIFHLWPQPDTTWAVFGSDYQPLIAQIPGATGRTNAINREMLKQLVRQNRPDLVSQGTPAWLANPGGGGNWKSNANSILPRCVFIRAVQEATEESLSKDASTYGKLVNLIVENQLSQRQEIIDLKNALNRVLELFSPDQNNPEGQALEIKELERKINDGLREVIGGEARIRTETPDVNSLLLPNTSLVIRDVSVEIDTKIAHQGHGLQRTLVMTLLQILAEAQETSLGAMGDKRAVMLIVEEPELYMHPQMERRMRDLLYRLSSEPSFQVACCTHSPVFIDIANRHKSIVRMSKAANGHVSVKQVTQEIFVGPADEIERQRLSAVSRFNPSVNEVFFSNEVVIMEELTAVAAFERAAEVTGIFARHPQRRRGVSIIETTGKGNIPSFQKVLNAFEIPYRVIHDEDRSQPQALTENLRIVALAGTPPGNRPIHMVGPESIENTLGYVAQRGAGKPYAAVRRVEELHSLNALPQPFVEAMNFVYFGTLDEPLL